MGAPAHGLEGVAASASSHVEHSVSGLETELFIADG